MSIISRAWKLYRADGLSQLLVSIASYSGQFLTDVAPIMKEEVMCPQGNELTFRTRVWAWRNGFTSQAYCLFELNENPEADYLSSWQQKRIAENINGWRWADDDRLLYRLHPEITPHLYGTLSNGQLITENGDQRDAGQWLIETVKSNTDLVIKPIGGEQGIGVLVIKRSDDAITINGQVVSDDDVVVKVASLDGMLVCEFIQQHDYAEQIFSRATNTIRFLTMVPPDSNEAFIAAAVHRFGGDRTGPVDNWSQGGICAEIIGL